MGNNVENLRALMGSRYDLLYVVTPEEERAVNDLKSVAAAFGMPVCTWSFTSGAVWSRAKIPDMPQANNGLQYGVQVGPPCYGDPVAILDMVSSCPVDAVFIIKDFHAFLASAEPCRKLKDVVLQMKSIYTPVVIVSPVYKAPVEIEKMITVYEYVLPSREEISVFVDAVVEYKRETDTAFIFNAELRESTVRACQGLTMREIENVIARSITECGTINPSAVASEKRQIIKKSGILEHYEVDDFMADVGGMDLLKDWLMKRRAALGEKAREYGLPNPKGILMIGVPGCGKSLLAKAVSTYWNLPLLRFDVGAVMQSLVGSSEENMRRVIQTAEASAPCVLWIDEIEKGLSGTGSSNYSDAGTTSRVFGTFITWLNEKKSQVFVIATANNVEQLPPELLRKGRFDETFFVDLPNLAERKEIFNIHIRKLDRDVTTFDTDSLAQAAEGFSGADIREAIVSALYDVFFDGSGQAPLETEHVLKAIKETVPLSKMMAQQITEIRNWCVKNRARYASSKNG